MGTSLNIDLLITHFHFWKLKALQEKIRIDSQRIKKIEKKEESEREKKIGKLILGKLKNDSGFSEWFFDGIKLHLTDNTQTLFIHFF